MTELGQQSATITIEDMRQNEWQLLQVYLYYRLVVAISLTATFFLSTEQFKVSFAESDRLYFATVTTYLVLTVLSLLISRLKTGKIGVQVFIVIITDIIAVALLEYTNGPSNTNLSILLVVTVAAGSILIQGRLALFFAAVATLVVLYKQIMSAILHGNLQQQEFLQSAFVGVACFATAILAKQIAKRLRESEELADKQAEDLANLEELNHHVIQRMRTGILVVNNQGKVVMINDSCWKMFGMPDLPKQTTLESISPALAKQLKDWRHNPQFRTKPFRAYASGPEVQANFTQLETGEQANALVFVDDNTRMAQQAQQLKLASLGGLTANIAHEIRNPLGAISHAAQLLQESEHLNKGDARLSDIIHRHSVRMNKVIENVLQLSRRKQSEPELLLMAEWMTNFIQDFLSTQHDESSIEFVCENEQLRFRIDPSQIQQVLTNLFQNGLRYSQAKIGEPKLKVVADFNTQTEQPTLDIIDYGAGVPEDKQDKIFEPFYTSESSGTGLGLYIARELCEANQARLDLVPTEEGCCFRITFSHPDRIVTI